MKHRIGIVALAASLIGGFAAIGAYFHDLSGAASYDVTAWRGASRQQGQVSALAGGQLFNGRGSCMACHSIGESGVGIRGPNLGVLSPDFTEPIAVRAAHAQEGKTAVEHVVEALYDPDGFLVPGFEGGIMIAVNGPPTTLTDEEIRSIVLYLFQQSGVPVTPELEEEIATAQRVYTGEQAPDGPEEPSEDLSLWAERGRERFAALGCDRCHLEQESAEAERPVASLAGAAEQVELLLRIARHSSEDPAGQPTTYGTSLTVQDAEDLAAFLLLASREAPTDGPEP